MESYTDSWTEDYNSEYDWTAEVIEDGSLDDLDCDAIKLARNCFKKRYPDLAHDCANWSDEVFLDKAGLI